MKSTVKILLVTLALGVISCSPKGDGTVSEVMVNGHKMFAFSLNSLKSDTTTVPLSSLVENCILVQLETKDDAYFNPQFTTITEKYIGIRDRRREPYKIFDRSGKFIGIVGAVGQGPGEYAISVYDDIKDDTNELIYLATMTGDKILVYNMRGIFLKNIVAPHNINKPKMYLSDNILTVVHMAFPNSKAIALQFDVNTGEVLKELAPPAHLLSQSFDGEIWNPKNVAGIFDVAYTNSDTLYHFDSKNNQFTPCFTMTYDGDEKPYRQYFQLNKDLLMTNVFGRGLVATDLKNKTSSYIKVVNDYFGNLPTPANVMTFRNGYYVLNIQPEQLMEDIEKRLSERNCTESDKQILQKTLSTLKENDNNVVFIGKLKSGVQTKLF